MNDSPSFLRRLRAPVLGALSSILALSLMAAETPPALKDAFKEYFPIGTAANRSTVTGGAGFRRSPEQNSADVATLRHHFNQIVAENDMKWQLIHPREGESGYEFGPADALVSFGLSNGMLVVGHTLVWHSQTPNWVFAGTNPPPLGTTNPPPALAAGTNGPSTNRLGRGGFGPGFGRYTGPRASREELLQRMSNHIHTVVGRYEGRVKVWDVVNEALADDQGTNVLRTLLWSEIIGPDFIAHAFRFAHAADPDAILRYNDYGLEGAAKRKRLMALIRELQAQQVPVHAIGSQAHVNVSTSYEAMDEALTEMATLGLPIHITELDVNGAQGGQGGVGANVADNAAATQGGLVTDADRKLADAYAGIFRAFVKHRDSVKLVTFWGVNDAVSWRAQGKPLLFDGDNQPKAAFRAVLTTVGPGNAP